MFEPVAAIAAPDAAPAARVRRRVPTAWALALAAVPLVLLLGVRPWHLRLSADFYLPLHTLLELLVVAAGVSTFAVQWFAAGAGAFREARARFIGPAFVAAAALETLHFLNFPGMPGVLGPSSTERGIYYWLAARFVTCVALLAALRIRPESDSPHLRRGRLVVVNVAIVLAVVAGDVALPADRTFFFVDGHGLTRLKLVLEAFVLVLAALGAIGHGRVYRRTGERASRYIAAALAMTVLSEACFMLYEHAYDPFNVLGHAYLVASFWFVFDALFVSAIVRPYRDLDALNRLVDDELKVTIRRLERATESREDLLRAVSHDLRNPLQIVLLQGQRLARAHAADAPVAKPVGAILTAARRMERMLRDLADSARSEGGSLQLARERVEVKAFVDGLLSLADGVLERDRVEVHIPADIPPVLADPDRLDRILVNLVGNALKYSRERVTVTAEPGTGDVRISVADRGAGISAEALPRIFDRYYRGERHEGEGLGLGLFIVRKLVEAHGGEVWVASTPGVGSTFTFTMPRA